MRAVWVVEGSTGEYSDHREWPIGWYETQAEAEDVVTALTRAVKAFQNLAPDADHPDDYEARDYAREQMRATGIDPFCSIDYTGINYRAYELEPGPSAGDIANRVPADNPSGGDG